jgi:hypothetical protein
LRYPADPPTVEEIILVMREAGPSGWTLQVVLPLNYARACGPGSGPGRAG